jgi:hypothetical protein
MPNIKRIKATYDQAHLLLYCSRPRAGTPTITTARATRQKDELSMVLSVPSLAFQGFPDIDQPVGCGKPQDQQADDQGDDRGH